MKTLRSMAVGVVPVLTAGTSWAQSGNMMNGGFWGGGWSGGWMGGYGGVWMPILVVVIVVALVVWIIKGKGK